MLADRDDFCVSDRRRLNGLPEAFLRHPRGLLFVSGGDFFDLLVLFSDFDPINLLCHLPSPYVRDRLVNHAGAALVLPAVKRARFINFRRLRLRHHPRVSSPVIELGP